MSKHDAIALYHTKAPVSSGRPGGFDIAKMEGSETDFTIRIFGSIDAWEQTAEDFISQFEAIDSETSNIDIQVNSRGGDIVEAMAIVDTIKAAKGKTTGTVLGIAASAASVIICACETRRIGANARFMIHQATIGVVGRTKDLREVAALGDTINAQAAQIYADVSGQDLSVIEAWMDEEKWFLGQEAVEAGFFGSVVDISMSAEVDEEDLREFANVPMDLLDEVTLDTVATETEVAVEDDTVVETPELVSVELCVNGKTISMSVSADVAEDLKSAGSLITEPVEPEIETPAPVDPIVAKMKSDAVNAPVMTARPNVETASQRKAPAPWNASIAAMNANFGKI